MLERKTARTSKKGEEKEGKITSIFKPDSLTGCNASQSGQEVLNSGREQAESLKPNLGPATTVAQHLRRVEHWNELLHIGFTLI